MTGLKYGVYRLTLKYKTQPECEAREDQDGFSSGTSHLYVLTSTFPNGIQDPDDILGVLSIIIYSILTITVGKYTFMVLSANNNGDEGEREVAEMVEPEEPKIAEATRSEAVAETSEKMNKSGRTTQEKDALDKILAEQGERPSTSKSSAPPPQEEKPNKLILSKYLLINAGNAVDRDSAPTKQPR
ncbi:hypothetical protein DKX38_028294 [Salix brachista]|uniref:K+ potassium transporter integral membrane domain-containing protein n=1 Tax=Salix brachista TaxID=2182728 RepID=A0A5N5J574_9ROSI|nr:hypothetical protein DKX38_028294 [Salix brachista]